MSQPARNNERGSGLISTSLGVVMLMLLLLFSLHVLLALHTRTVVGAAAWDVAQAAASPDGGKVDAQERVDNLIGGLNPTVKVSTGGDVIVVTVSAKSPGLLPGVTSLNSLRKVTRTVRVRREVFR